MDTKNLVIHHVSKRPWPAYPKGPLEWVICYEYKGEWKPKTERLIDMMSKGFSLMELLITLVVVSILALFGASTVFGGIDCKEQKMGWITRAKVNAAIGDIGAVHLQVRRKTEFTQGPIDIDSLDLGLDRWGNPYQFLDHSTVNGHGPKRKSHGQVPVNSRYDLYSMGPDGRTRTPMTSTPGEDDIVLANDGQYIGVACFYDQ